MVLNVSSTGPAQGWRIPASTAVCSTWSIPQSVASAAPPSGPCTLGPLLGARKGPGSTMTGFLAVEPLLCGLGHGCRLLLKAFSDDADEVSAGPEFGLEGSQRSPEARGVWVDQDRILSGSRPPERPGRDSWRVEEAQVETFRNKNAFGWPKLGGFRFQRVLFGERATFSARRRPAPSSVRFSAKKSRSRRRGGDVLQACRVFGVEQKALHSPLKKALRSPERGSPSPGIVRGP